MQKTFIYYLLALFLISCKSVPTDDRTLTLVTLKGPSSMGMVQMADSLSRSGDTTLKIEIVSEPMMVRKMMIDGSADFCVLPTTMASVLYNKGIDYQLIAIPVWGTLYLFGDKSVQINSWQDLKGKRVFVMAKGMTPDLLFRYLLHRNGIDPDNNIILDYSFPTHIDLANAVAAGKAQIGIISEPYVSLVMQRNKNIIPFMNLDAEWSKIEGIPIAETALLGRREVIEKHPDIVEQLIHNYAQSSIWVNAHPVEAAGLIVKYRILPDTAAALRAIPYSNLKVVDCSEVKRDINEYLKVFFNMSPESIGGKLPDEKFYYKY